MLNFGDSSLFYGGNLVKRVLLISTFLIAPAMVWARGPRIMPTIPSAGAAPATTVTSGPSPKISCAKPNFDFKTVDEGPDIVHEFRIVNQGKGVLTISSVTTSCGCTAAVVKKLGSKDEAATLPVDIRPGGKGTIKATYHTTGHVGHNTKVITVTSNDSKNPSFQLKLDMTVVREIDVQPDRIWLNNIQHGQAESRAVTILGKPKNKLKILSAQTSGGVVTVTSVTPFKDEKEKRQGAILQVDLPKERPIGSFTDSIVVKTNDPKKDQIDIAVTGEVMGKFQYNPRTLNLSTRQTAPNLVVFTAQDPKSFLIRKVESVHHLARASVKKISLGNGVEQWQVSVTGPRELPKGSDGKDQILVSTSDFDQPQVAIEISITQ